MLKTLYEICLRELVFNFEKVEDLEYVPFDPFITDILNYIIETKTIDSKKRQLLSKTILRKIGESHGQQLRQKKYLHFGSFLYQCHTSNKVNVNYFIQNGAPQFITRLDLSLSSIHDEDLVNFKLLTNLIVLDLTNTLISDTGMSHLARFTQPNDDTSSSSRMAFLQHLKILSVAYCQYITDRSLRYIPRMKKSLIGIDLSTTLITPTVASTFLSEHGYQRVSNLKSYHNNKNKDPATTTKISSVSASASATTTSFHFRYRSSSSDTIVSTSHEQFKKEYCPQHSSSLITYCDNKLSEEYGSKTKLLNNEIPNPGYRIQQNEFLNMVMNEGYLFNPYIKDFDVYKEWVSWWKRNGKDQRIDLVFILKPSTKETSSNKKRSLEMEKDNTSNNNIDKLERPVKRKNGLHVKQSIDVTTFLQNFQL